MKLDKVLYPQGSPIKKCQIEMGDMKCIEEYLRYGEFLQRGGNPLSWDGDKSVIDFDKGLLQWRS